MDFKLFMNSVEENLSLIKTEEELRNWIRNYARSIPEEERGSFLEQIQIRKSRSHKEILQELTDWCAKIEEGEITLSCSGYEEYGESWWDRDWVTEYEDPMGIGAQLKCYYEEAEQAVYDRDYESAGQMYWSLGVLNITADDVYGGEPAELGIEEMVSENLVSLNLKQIASLTLYSTYQAYELPERIPKLYGFFSWHMFENIGIEDIYKTTIVFAVKDLTEEKINSLSSSSFLRVNYLQNIKTDNLDMNEYHERLIKRLNSEQEIKAYSFLPTGLGHYENKKELMNQILRQALQEDRKYIYVYIDDYDIEKLNQSLETITEEITNAVLLVIGINKEESTLTIWKKKEIINDWIIRRPESNEYRTFSKMAMKFEKIYRTKRKDIFTSYVPYESIEFNSLCNPHQMRILLIYEQDKEMLGFIEAERINTIGSYRYTPARIIRIHRIFVVEERRREKIGTRLYQAILDFARKERYSRIEVQIYNFTPEAQAFFESFGLKILAYQYETPVSKK